MLEVNGERGYQGIQWMKLKGILDVSDAGDQ
jgi:hypothetical protein